ncbi:nucleotidyltransferase domain-containing protein [Xaviernesmea oryzae]|nr:nucleotidyltransferase domain-containing protein [Xaviernesmea oryzae]
MEHLNARAYAKRHAEASQAVAHVLHAAQSQGFDLTVIGSFARGDFRAHSDVDLLARGAHDRKSRIVIERLVAESMRPFAMPYDLIFEDDLTEDRLREFLNDGL